MTTTTAADDEVNQKHPLQDKVVQNHRKDLKLPYKENGKFKDEETKRSIPAYKYSNNRKGLLHESAIVAGIPVFIKYENGQVEVVDHIEEPSRIIRPPRIEEYPYPPYEFANVEELREYVNKAKSSNIESLHLDTCRIVRKYIEQEEDIIIVYTADIVWSYFQDSFPTTHYINLTGETESGKSTMGDVFQFTGYRPVKASAISAANYYRALGTVEPGQCTIIEDESDGIEEDKDKMKILNDGYQYTGKTFKVNMNTKDQTQNWFYAYCLKIMISEKPLSPTRAKALLERTLTFHCKPTTNYTLHSIKEIAMNPPGDPEKQKLYRELMDFRRLMLCYRLIHSTDYMPDIDTALRNRDNELGGPLLRLFHDTETFGKIKDALQKFLAQRKGNGRQRTIDSALQPLIVKLVTENNTLKLPVGLIWNEATNTIPGRLNPQNLNEYQTNEYGTIHRNTLSQVIVDAFGAEKERKNNGIVLTFDEEKIMELKKMYDHQDIAKDRYAAPDNYTEPHKNEDNNTLEDKSEGSVSSEGYRVCGFIIE